MSYNNQSLTCKEINDISIIDFLNTTGIEPVKKLDNFYRYYSPIRKESTPSFDVSLNKNVWIDRGTGEGGTLVDLCVKLENSTVSEVVKKFNNDSFSFRQLNYSSKTVKAPHYKIISKKLLKEKRLCDYLEERAIKLSVAKIIVNEYHYSLDSRKYFGIGIDNVKGGVELRNKYFKGSLGPKGISLFEGKTDKLLVFEGLMDFLSHLTFCKKNTNSSHVLIMNSTLYLNSTIELISKSPHINEIYHFLDHDDAGRTAAQALQNLNRKTYDMSFLYSGFNDYNDMLKSRMK
jgi:DNA primase